VRNLILDCGLPSGLGEVQIPYEAVESMAASALQIQRLLKNNPRELSVTDAENIYRAAFNAEIHE
jgi:alcohol dehydrogenase class IV